mmetsp:Transcript_24734/g.73569  ORF Transcript_24734/g.73569 Transcript_24734/m.73569 type:complete len:443 (-) Transcript_24734:366-1694(-)
MHHSGPAGAVRVMAAVHLHALPFRPRPVLLPPLPCRGHVEPVRDAVGQHRPSSGLLHLPASPGPGRGDEAEHHSRWQALCAGVHPGLPWRDAGHLPHGALQLVCLALPVELANLPRLRLHHGSHGSGRGLLHLQHPWRLAAADDADLRREPAQRRNGHRPLRPHDEAGERRGARSTGRHLLRLPHDLPRCPAGGRLRRGCPGRHLPHLRDALPHRHDDPGHGDHLLRLPVLLPGGEGGHDQRRDHGGLRRLHPCVRGLAALHLQGDHPHRVGDHRVHWQHGDLHPGRAALRRQVHRAGGAELPVRQRHRLASRALRRSHADPRVHDRLRVALPQLLWAGCNEEGGSCHDVERPARRRGPGPGDHRGPFGSGQGELQGGISDHVPRGWHGHADHSRECHVLRTPPEVARDDEGQRPGAPRGEVLRGPQRGARAGCLRQVHGRG